MPSKCDATLSSRLAKQDGSDLVEMVNRELVPVVRSLRSAFNLAVGPVLATDSDVTVTEEYQYYLVDSSGGIITVTLPSAALWKLPVTIKRVSAGSNVVIQADGSDLIDGTGTATLTTQYESVTLVSDEGTGWWEV